MLRGAIRSNRNEAPTLELTTPSATQAGDTLVVLQFSDAYEAANLQEPAPGGGTWTLLATADLGADFAHGKAWARTAPSAGQQTVELRQGTDPAGGGGNDDACQFGWLAVVAGPAVVDDADAGHDFAETAQVAPGLDLSQAPGVYIAGWATSGGTTTYTLPPAMNAAEQLDCGAFASSVAASEDRNTSGPIGSRTAAADPARNFVALSVVVRSSSEPVGAGQAATVILRPRRGVASAMTTSGTGQPGAVVLTPGAGQGFGDIGPVEHSGPGEAAGVHLTPGAGRGFGAEGQLGAIRIAVSGPGTSRTVTGPKR